MQEQTGTVYWFTGLPGAGKSTLGRAFFNHLKSHFANALYLDGDQLREVFGLTNSAYSLKEREELAFRYSKLCRLVSDQGIHVVIATVSMFDSVRAFNRKEIKSYKEIFIQVPHEVLVQRDQKQLYSTAAQGKTADVIGVNQTFEEPKNPDVILQNDGKKSVEALVTQLTKEFISHQLLNKGTLT